MAPASRNVSSGRALASHELFDPHRVMRASTCIRRTLAPIEAVFRTNQSTCVRRSGAEGYLFQSLRGTNVPKITLLPAVVHKNVTSITFLHPACRKNYVLCTPTRLNSGGSGLTVKNRNPESVESASRITRPTGEAGKNEDPWKNFQTQTMALLEADHLPDLFERLTDGMCRDYGLQAASVALADPDHEIRNLLRGQGRSKGEFGDVLFVDAIRRLVPGIQTRPWVGPYQQASHERLFAPFTMLRSVAIIPLVRQTRLIGSLHLGSDDPCRFAEGEANDFLGFLASIAAFGLENAVNRARLIETGFTDRLTGWYNRRYLDTRLRDELARCQREQDSVVCLLLDVDHFKRVNDRHGHAAGDAVLRELASRVAGKIRGSDISARYGGEEFIVLLPGAHFGAGRLLAERIRTAVSATPFPIGDGEAPLKVTVSIGIAEYRPTLPEEDPDRVASQLVADADVALYEAKRAGRNTVALAAA
jgi:two-component system cell cycle response regulator